MSASERNQKEFAAGTDKNAKILKMTIDTKVSDDDWELVEDESIDKEYVVVEESMGVLDLPE